MSFRTQTVVAALLISALAECAAETPTGPEEIFPLPTARVDGTWHAVYWIVKTPNEAPRNVWEEGGREDTFARHVAWRIVNDRFLIADQVVGGTRFSLSLVRTEMP